MQRVPFGSSLVTDGRFEKLPPKTRLSRCFKHKGIGRLGAYGICTYLKLLSIQPSTVIFQSKSEMLCEFQY